MMKPDEMRARFAELRKERDKVEAKLAPLHDKVTEIRSAAAEEEAKLADKIKATREPLVAIDEELAMISRALNGKTGS